MTTKRSLAPLLALLLLLAALFPQSALAEDEAVVLAVETVDGASGDEVDVQIEMERCEAVDSLQFNLNYDADALKAVRVTPGTAFPAEYCVTNIQEAGRVRAACVSALGLSAEDGGVMMTVTFRLLNATGSAVTFSDVIATRVDVEYNQSQAYVQVENGGVTAGRAALPAPVTTPWIAQTPAQTPSPTPEATQAPTPAVFADKTPSPTPEAQDSTAGRAMLPYIIVGVFAVLAAAAIGIVLISSGKSSRRRKKRRKKKKSGARRG